MTVKAAFVGTPHDLSPQTKLAIALRLGMPSFKGRILHVPPAWIGGLYEPDDIVVCVVTGDKVEAVRSLVDFVIIGSECSVHEACTLLSSSMTRRGQDGPEQADEGQGAVRVGGGSSEGR